MLVKVLVSVQACTVIVRVAVKVVGGVDAKVAAKEDV